MKIEFAAKNGRDGLNPAANTGRFLNCYIEPIGGRAGYQIRSVPGMEQITDMDRVFMRGMIVFDGDLVTLCGGVVSRITTGARLSDIGIVGDSVDSGLSVNTGFLTIVAAGKYYHFDGTDLVELVAGDLAEVSSVTYLGGYTILSERGTRRLAWSALADPTAFNGLDFASAETTDEPITRLIATKDLLFVFKERSMEGWQVTGLPGPDAFQRVPGMVSEIGLRSYGLVTTMPNGMAFVGSDGRVYVWGVPTPISTPQVEVALSEYQPERMFFYEVRGHGFLCIAFKDAPAWCYDVATGEWHERAERGGPWSVRQSALFNGVWHVGTDTGRVSRLTARCDDNGAALVRTITSMPVENSRPFRVARLEVFPRIGSDVQSAEAFVLDDGESALVDDGVSALGYGVSDDAPARIGISTSRDGRTWGQEHVRDVGEVGEYGRRVVFRNLGRFANLGAFKVSISSSRDVPILSAAEVEIQ